MPIISVTDRKSTTGRLVILGIYIALIIGGAAMVYPFMVMVTGAVCNPFDYDRRSPLPYYLWQREDRFMHFLCNYFPPTHRQSMRQLRCFFPDLPEDWQIWSQAGDDRSGTSLWVRKQLSRLSDPATREQVAQAARDYGEFNDSWNLRETVLAYDQRYVAPFLRERYKTLEALNQAWEISIDDFPKVNASEWSGEPIDQASYVPLMDTRYRDLLDFRQAYRENRYTPYLGGPDAPANGLRPAALRWVWEDFVLAQEGDAAKGKVVSLPFPVPADADAHTRELWLKFLKSGFPLRHVEIAVDPQRSAAFTAFLITRFRSLDYLNRVMGGTAQEWRPVRSWDEVRLTPTVPDYPLGKVWMDFVLNDIPPDQWRIRNTLPEQAFQAFALRKHGSLRGINEAYGLKLASLQQLRIPFGEAFLWTFANREWPMLWDNVTVNFRAVWDYLIHRGLAVRNTVILVVLSILIALTVNPLCGYALSRFRLRSTERIIIFCLATMAFPAAVAAIPGFLLLRDLGLLNTFAALVLPGAANGMTTFLLKGFFDSLPRELYEAAAIDGAPEWMVFWRISLPLVKPILAVGMLNAFLAAYNGWEWAIIVCQDPKIWTVAVWTFQFSQTMGSFPYTVMAAFMVNSIPVLLVFLLCQKVILRGIILPQMK